MEQKKNGTNVETEPVPDTTNKQRKEKNVAIRKNVLWYVAVMLALVGAILLAEYSVTGSVALSVGIITAIITRNVHRLKTGYEYDEAHSRWFVLTLAFTALLGTLLGFVVCQKFSGYVYEVSNGSMTPWSLFALVTVVMAVVFGYSNELRKKKEGKAKRPYTFLMVISACLVVSQCVGSISSSRDIDYEQWKKSCNDVEITDEATTDRRDETMVVGAWVHNADILGVKQVIEEFRNDGTWQQGNADGIQSKGRWTYLGDGEVRIQETWIVVGETQSPSSNEWILRIDNLQDDEMTIHKGDFTMTYKRMEKR